MHRETLYKRTVPMVYLFRTNYGKLGKPSIFTIIIPLLLDSEDALAVI